MQSNTLATINSAQLSTSTNALAASDQVGATGPVVASGPQSRTATSVGYSILVAPPGVRRAVKLPSLPDGLEGMVTSMDSPLLSLRSTLVFLLALLAGAAAGGLTAVAGEGIARSLLAGLTAAGLGVPFFNHLIEIEGSAVQPSAPAGTDGKVVGEKNG